MWVGLCPGKFLLCSRGTKKQVQQEILNIRVAGEGEKTLWMVQWWTGIFSQGFEGLSDYDRRLCWQHTGIKKGRGMMAYAGAAGLPVTGSCETS